MSKRNKTENKVFQRKGIKRKGTKEKKKTHEEEIRKN